MPRKTLSDPDYFGPQVYIATNIVDDMKYIGKTKTSFNCRHKYLDKNHDFSRAYHRERHNWIIKVFPCKSESAANKLEYEKVRNWHVKSKKYYNRTTGGQGGTTESRAKAKAYRNKQKEIEVQRIHANRFNSHQVLYERNLKEIARKLAARKALPKKVITSIFWGIFNIIFNPLFWISIVVLNNIL